MSAVRWVLALLMLIGVTSAANGAEVAIPPPPAQWATDTAGFLKPQTVAALDARLRAYQRATGHQILVYVAPTTGAVPTEDWTVRAFARWKVGRKGLDDGLILFVFATDHKVRIEVGYGLEQIVPDAVAARIIRTMTAKLRAGQPDDAVTAGVDGILGAVGGAAARGTAAPAASGLQPGSDPVGVAIGGILCLLLIGGVFILVARLPRRSFFISGGRSIGHGAGGFTFSSSGSSGGGFSGGGFSGGGGSSGGGGASGSW
jgi:uncharacterized protein